MIVVTVWLHEVDDVEAVGFVFLRVGHTEKVPLGEAIGPIVILEVEIVFRIRLFHSLPEVG